MAAAIGIGEEGEEDEKKAREGKCETVFGSPESWLITKWHYQNSPKTVKLQKAITKGETTRSSQKTHTVIRETLFSLVDVA